MASIQNSFQICPQTHLTQESLDYATDRSICYLKATVSFKVSCDDILEHFRERKNNASVIGTLRSLFPTILQTGRIATAQPTLTDTLVKNLYSLDRRGSFPFLIRPTTTCLSTKVIKYFESTSSSTLVDLTNFDPVLTAFFA